MATKDYYKILGIEKTASAEVIKKAFYELIKNLHPDQYSENQEILEKFHEVNEAYEVLGDLENRLNYSILLNKDLLNEKLLHKNFKIPPTKSELRRMKRLERIKEEKRKRRKEKLRVIQ